MKRWPKKQCGTFPPRVRHALVRVVLVVVCWFVAVTVTRAMGYGAEEAGALVSAVAALASGWAPAPESPGRVVPLAKM